MNKNELANMLGEFLMEQDYNEKAGNTVKKYRGNVTRFLDYLSEGELTKEEVMKFKQYLIDCKFKTATINSYIVSVNKYLKWCGQGDKVVKQIKQQRKSSLESILSISDYKRLLKFAKKLNRMDIYYIMKIFALTGIRVSELEFFTVENIKSNYIRVFNKGKERYVVVRQDLSRELRKYARENKIKVGYLFPGMVPGKMINESTIWRQMKKIAGKARVNKSKVHAHSFRHLFAKLYLEENENHITELADILGHNSLETTRIYTRSTNEEKRKRMEKMNFV
jgi:integrase